MGGGEMSNHLGDTNKMVSRNPRMNASAHDDGAIWETGCDIERELNAAQQRIKQLEESENRMLNWLTEDCPEAVKKQLSNAWMKSKEAKP
jgi:hypothetical protein